jgi:glutamine synthetase
MNQINFALSPDPLVKFLNKARNEFTKIDIINYIEQNNIELLNFRYVGGDGRLKVLNFMIQSLEHLDLILSAGERVDGSSIFNFLEAGSSDLYVVPRFKTAFHNPFSQIPAVDILCSFYHRSGDPLESAPEYVMRKAHEALVKATGYELEVMAEIEYYVISEKHDEYRTADQRGYHESGPFIKWEHLRIDAMRMITQTGGKVKYGHSEVGSFSDGLHDYEQNEIEFLPVNVEDATDQIIIAKWILREIGHHYGVMISFAPKITVGKAGSGLHIHMRPMKNGKNITLKDGQLSDVAKKVIAGVLDIAPALSAFGNTIPTSYFRLVPNQEAPTMVCWGDRNRSALVRVPLGWSMNKDMVANANPLETPSQRSYSDKQTFELRSPDASADIYLLIAGICVGARHGLEMPNGLDMAAKTYVNGNIFNEDHREEHNMLTQLPDSCQKAADALLEKADVFQKYDVFTSRLIEGVAKKLKAYHDKDLRKRISGNHDETMKLVEQFLHCG